MAGPERGRDAAKAASPAERLADAIVHAVGIAGALAALPVLLTLAAVFDGGLPVMLALSVYAATTLAMLGFSGAYNLVRAPRARAVLRRLDHAAIYLKIAGTQTPFAVLAGTTTAFWLLGAVWFAALAGAAVKLARLRGPEMLSVAAYLALGWAGLLLVPSLADRVTGAAVLLILAGGLLYSAGVVFHLWERLPFHNAIWHGFVVAATFVFYSAILVEVVAASPH